MNELTERMRRIACRGGSLLHIFKTPKKTEQIKIITKTDQQTIPDYLVEDAVMYGDIIQKAPENKYFMNVKECAEQNDLFIITANRVSAKTFATVQSMPDYITFDYEVSVLGISILPVTSDEYVVFILSTDEGTDVQSYHALFMHRIDFDSGDEFSSIIMQNMLYQFTNNITIDGISYERVWNKDIYILATLNLSINSSMLAKKLIEQGIKTEQIIKIHITELGKFTLANKEAFNRAAFGHVLAFLHNHCKQDLLKEGGEYIER